MRKSRDLNACICFLEDLQRGGNVDPEKKAVVGYAVKELKRIRRTSNLRRNELHESMRRIVEALVQAFMTND